MLRNEIREPNFIERRKLTIKKKFKNKYKIIFVVTSPTNTPNSNNASITSSFAPSSTNASMTSSFAPSSTNGYTASNTAFSIIKPAFVSTSCPTNTSTM